VGIDLAAATAGGAGIIPAPRREPMIGDEEGHSEDEDKNDSNRSSIS